MNSVFIEISNSHVHPEKSNHGCFENRIEIVNSLVHPYELDPVLITNFPKPSLASLNPVHLRTPAPLIPLLTSLESQRKNNENLRTPVPLVSTRLALSRDWNSRELFVFLVIALNRPERF